METALNIVIGDCVAEMAKLPANSIELRAHGLTLTAIGRTLGITRQAVGAVLKRGRI